MRDFSVETSGGPGRNSVSDSIALGPGLVLQGTRMRFSRNAEIFGEGEPADYVYKVVSGAVRTMRFTADGRRQILAFQLPGDVFGLEQEATHACSAEAVSDCDVVLVRRSLIDRAASESTGAAQALMRLLARQLQSAHEHALVLGQKAAGGRVAAFLLKLGQRYSAGRDIDLPMSRADIADHLALTIETVSRAFTQMEREHCIDLPSSRHVVVRDAPALESLQAA